MHIHDIEQALANHAGATQDLRTAFDALVSDPRSVVDATSPAQISELIDRVSEALSGDAGQMPAATVDALVAAGADGARQGDEYRQGAQRALVYADELAAKFAEPKA